MTEEAKEKISYGEAITRLRHSAEALGIENIQQYGKFKTEEERDEYIVQKVNEGIHKEGTVVMLVDYSDSEDAVAMFVHINHAAERMVEAGILTEEMDTVLTENKVAQIAAGDIAIAEPSIRQAISDLKSRDESKLENFKNAMRYHAESVLIGSGLAVRSNEPPKSKM